MFYTSEFENATSHYQKIEPTPKGQIKISIQQNFGDGSQFSSAKQRAAPRDLESHFEKHLADYSARNAYPGSAEYHTAKRQSSDEKLINVHYSFQPSASQLNRCKPADEYDADGKLTLQKVDKRNLFSPKDKNLFFSNLGSQLPNAGNAGTVAEDKYRKISGEENSVKSKLDLQTNFLGLSGYLCSTEKPNPEESIFDQEQLQNA